MKPLRRWAVGLLLTLTTLVLIMGLRSPAPAQTPAEITLESAGLTLEEIADGVYGLIASTDFPPANPEVAICNGAIVIGSEGVLLVDPFQTEALANLMLETAASLSDLPVRYVVNTHYHFDHTGGNAAVEAMNLPIRGRGPIRDFMLSRNLEQDPNAAPPGVILKGDNTLWLGDRQVQLYEYEGHSGGTDLIVYVPDADVMIAGDLLFTQRIPYLGDANIRTLQATLDQLEVAYPTAAILPGHGPVSDRSALADLEGYLEYLESLALNWQAEGLSQAAAIEQTTIADDYADYLFQGLFPTNLEAAYQQITLGQDDAASIREYFQAQAPALRAL